MQNRFSYFLHSPHSNPRFLFFPHYIYLKYFEALLLFIHQTQKYIFVSLLTNIEHPSRTTMWIEINQLFSCTHNTSISTSPNTTPASKKSLLPKTFSLLYSYLLPLHIPFRQTSHPRKLFLYTFR